MTLMFYLFGFPLFGHAAEAFRANFDSGTLNADYSVGTGTASNDGSAATITSPGYDSSDGAVTVTPGQTLKYPVANNLDPAKGEIEMKFQLPYDLKGDQSKPSFNGPMGIAYDSANDYVYVADSGNNRIVKTKMDGTGWIAYGELGSTVGKFNNPSSIFYDTVGGYLYIADTGNTRIVKTKMDGTGWTTYGASGTGVGQFSSPRGIYYDLSLIHISEPTRPY
jgi:DNA-binding beta-propeller fold protein YncE